MSPADDETPDQQTPATDSAEAPTAAGQTSPAPEVTAEEGEDDEEEFEDEFGNPIDRDGNPIEYEDEDGNPVDANGDPIEYEDDDGNPVDRDGNPIEYENEATDALQVNQATAQDDIVTAKELGQASALAALNGLDADILAAVRAGDTAVINAVLGGATTSAAVVNDIIAKGNTQGLSPAIQAMVEQQLAQSAAASAAGNRQTAELAAGAGLMALGGAARAGDQPTYFSLADIMSGQFFDKLSPAQRDVYFAELAKMDRQEYLKLPAEVQALHTQNVHTQAQENLQRTPRNQEELDAAMAQAGLSKDDIKIVMNAENGVKWGPDGKMISSKEEVDAYLNTLPEHLRQSARQRIDIVQQATAAGFAMAMDGHAGAQNLVHANTVSTSLQGAAPEQAANRAATYKAGDQALDLARQGAETAPEIKDAKASSTTNIDARAALDTKVVASTLATKPSADDEFGNDAPAAPAKVATAAPAASTTAAPAATAVDHRTMSGVDRMNTALAAFTAPEPAPVAAAPDLEQKRQLAAKPAAPAGMSA